MNPQAIQDAYTLFVGAGYKKDIESFKNLIKTNPNALNDAHTLFSQHGYKGGIDGFKVLMGLSDEELKKKDEPQTSGEESTEPQEQPTTPSAKPTPKAPLPSTPNELLYTGALKGLGGEKKESILTQTKPKQEPIDVTYQKEEMPSETTQGVVPITSKQRIQEAKKAEEEIKRGELPSNPNFITKETEAKVDARRKELGMNTLEEAAGQTMTKLREDQAKEVFADVSDEVDDYIKYSPNNSALFGIEDYDLASGKGKWTGFSGIGGKLEKTKEGESLLQSQGKRGEILDATMNDYFGYLDKKNPSQAEFYRNKYNVIKSSKDRDENDEKFLQEIENRALKLRAAVVKKDLDVYKTALGQYSQIEKRVNFQGYDKDVKELKQAAKTLNDLYESGKISEQEYQQRFSQIQQSFENARIKNGYTDDVVEKLDQAKSVYFAYGQSATKLSSLFGFMDQNSKEYRQYNQLQKEIEEAKKQREETWNSASWLEKMYLAPSEFARTFSGSVGNMVMDILQSPKVIEEFVTGDTNYNFLDEWYDGIENYQLGKGKQFGETDSESIVQYLSSLGGNAIGSIAVFGLGGSLGGTSKLAQFGSTFTTAFLSAEAGAYEEAISTYKMSPRQAATAATAVATATALVEGLIPDIKYFEAGPYRASVLKAIAEGKGVTQAAREALPGSAISYLKTGTKEGGEEIIGQSSEDITKSAINLIGQSEYYKDIWKAKNYRDSFLGGFIGGTTMNVFKRPQGASPIAEDVMLTAAENADAILAQNTNEKINSELKNRITDARNDFQSLQVHPNWSSLNRSKQAHVFGVTQQIRTLEGSDIKDPIIKSQIDRLKAEREEILSAGSNGVDAKLVGTSTSPQRVMIGGNPNPEQTREIEVLNQKMSQFVSPRASQLMNENKITRKQAEDIANKEWAETEDGKRRESLILQNQGRQANFFINEDGDYEIEYNNGKSVVISKGEGAAEKIREMGIKADDGGIAEVKKENQNTLITPTLEKGATIDYNGKNGIVNSFKEKDGKVVYVNVTTEDGRTLQIRDGQPGAGQELLDNLNSLGYDQKNQTGLPSQVGEGQESVTTQPIQTTGKEEAPTGGVLQAEEEVVPEALKDVESTAKALEGESSNYIKNSAKTILDFIGSIANKNLNTNWGDWFLGENKDAKNRIVFDIQSNSELRNALMSNLYDLWKKETKSNMPFDDFLNTEITLYRGGEKGFKNEVDVDGFNTWELTKEGARKFAKGEDIVEKKIPVKKLYGAVDIVGGEIEVLEKTKISDVFAKEIFEQQQWLNLISENLNSNEIKQLTDLTKQNKFNEALSLSKRFISSAYHTDKAAGKETELTKAVEELLGKPTEGTGKAAPEAKAEAPKPAEETKPTETGTTVSVGGGTMAGKMRQRRNTRKGIAPTEAKEEQKPPKEEGEKPSATKELEVTPSVRRAGAVEATESSNPDAGEDSALQAAGMTAQEVQEWKKNNRAQNKRPKIEQLTQAVKDLMSGKKSFKDYYKMAKELMPSKLMEKVPTPATFKEIIGAIDSNKLKIGIVGLNKFVKKGMRVGLRIDIPSFNNHGKNVVTVHDRSKAGQEVVGYGSTGSIKNVTFRTSVPTAAKIGAGETTKSAFAMAEGEWMDESPESIQKRAEEALNSPEWVQVGMNPARNSFFFDKSDNNPVVSADEVIQVGNLVLAKNPKKIDLNTAEGMAEFEKMFSKTDKDTGVTYQYRQAPSQKTGEVQTGRKFTGRSAVNRLVDFLKSANIDIQVVSDQEFQEIQKGTNLTGSVDGLFATDEKSGKIYLRESKVDTHFGDTLAFHEGIHPVMNIVANTNPKLYNAIFEGLKSWSKENTDAGRAIREVIERQLALAEELGWDPATLKDETIVEALATIVAKGLSIPKTQIGLRNSIIDFYNKIAKFLKLPTISRNATDADFRAFVNKLTNAIREGGDIRDVVGKENVKEFKNNIVGAELYQASITRFGESGIQKSPILDDDKFIQLLDKDQLNVKSPIESLGDELFMLTFPDDLFVGEIIIDEKTVAKFGGGVVYALVEGSNGRMWASVDENTARSFAANINKALEQSKDGFARVVLVKGSHIKHASSLQAKVGFMKTLLNFARGNSDFESQVMDAIREAYTINSTTLEGTINELDEYMAGSREGSGQTMGEAANSYAVFRSGLVKKANPMLADLVKKMGYGNEFFDAGGLKKSPPVYRVKNEFVDKIFADMLQEDFLNNLPEGSAYAVLKVTSPVKWEKDASHPSYPFVIKTIDGSPVIVDLLTSSFMTYGKDEAISGRKEKPGKESSAFGRASYTVPAYKLKPNVDENTPGAVSLSKKLLQYKGVATKFQPPKKGTKQKAQGSPSQQREMEPSLVDEAGLTKHMTEDDNGNYIFYHKTNKPLKTIDPKFFGKTLATSRGERPGVGISMYYTRPDAGESMVAGGYGYIVRVPKDKVYPINEDPLGLYEQAKKMFEKDYPGQAFDPNKQVGYITKLAGEMGFPMTVASWQKGPLALRAQSTTALKPEVHHTPSDYSTTAIDINQEIDVLEPNEVKIRREKRRAKGSPSQERPAEIGKYDPLPGAPTPKDATGPIKELVDIAEKYAQDNNIPYTRQGEYVEVDKEFAKSVAEAYAKMKHDPTNPRVIEAYNDLIRQTRDQYDRLIEAGYEFSFFDSETDPYNTNPMEAMRDLRKNKKMAVYGTYDGFGTEGITATELQNNPLLQDTGLRWKDQNGKEQVVTANDLFRAVHDAFGHGLEGAGFRARGEENAWQAHVRLFYGPAVGAITSETRGQNSWLNFNTDLYRNAVGDEKAKEMHPDNWETITVGEHNQRAQTNDTIFAEQKTGLMPEWTWTERRAQGSPSQQRGMDPEAAYDEVERMIEDGEASGMNGQQMYDSISKTEAYASLSPEDRTLVNDSIRSMGGITADPAASSIMSYDPGEKAAVLEALRDNKDLAYIYRNFREILTDLKEKGVIETDCI